MDHALAAMAGDVIGYISCGVRPGLIEEANFSPSWYELMVKTTTIAPLFRCFPWLNKLGFSFELSLCITLNTSSIAFLGFFYVILTVTHESIDLCGFYQPLSSRACTRKAFQI